jgi:UDP-N-acetylglucosamine transferase subunit ALG13
VNTTYKKALVVVTVGGDHHPFDRLMRWVEDWIVDEGDHAECLVQHGSARAPMGADARPYIDHRDLLTSMAAARAVVSSGGPTTLAEARQLGHRPIAVPRHAALGEHVDDHQRAFTRRLHESGLIVTVETEADFRSALSTAIDAPRIVPDGSGIASATVLRVGDLIDATAARAARSKFGGWSRTDARI